ncbi:MAG: lysine transporter LysE [Verrucomicrobia bacterium RIFCSPHIGHO2_12_FULL_41_10]|nr:MAG: lysine transporter LysE [Verrucomicrobia bacterium RIFCSPHIGHO2_12_FULL_41_10]HLB33578.1 LysE family transporter [Chthoniobacterales bacterium]
MIPLFIKGMAIGFAIAAPVGPIGLLCIQRSLRDGLKIGFMTGLGAATADTFYGLIAAFGLTALSALLISYQFWIHLIGGLFLIYLGLRLLTVKSHSLLAKDRCDKSLWHAYGTTVLLTLMNPLTVLSFMAIFAGIGLGSQHRDYFHAFLLVLGIFLGSALWWFFLSGGVAMILHHRIKESSMNIINKISGGMILIFGIIALFY